MKTLIRAIAIAALGLFAATAKADLYTLNDNEDWSGRTQDLPTMVDLNGHMLTIDGAAFSSTRFTATSDSQSVLRVSVDEGQSATVKSDALSGNLKLVKIGSGRLIVPPLRIETECLQGELGVKGVYPVVIGKPIHRWSFTGGSLDDSAGGSTATLVGTKSDEVTFADNAVTFPGGNNGECYLDMGAGVIPESGEVTIEVWGTQNQVKDWSRIWCVGVDDKNFLSMAWSNGGKVDSDFVQLKENNSDHFFAQKTMAPYDVGTRFHISMRIFPSADGKTKFEWAKRDVSTGKILKSGSGETKSVWSLANFADRHFWLNHGFANSDAAATYDEVRIWNWALSDQELTDNVTAGPDVVLEREKEGVIVEEKVEEPEAPVVLHRWSFTGGSLNDSVGGSTAALVGAKSSEVTFANNTVTFPGGDNGECCLDMGAGVIPESGEVTIEVWCTQNETKDWSRIWCVGRDDNNFLSMFWTWDGRINNDFIQLKDDKTPLVQAGQALSPYTVGTQFHISMKIFRPGADGKTKLEWAKRDVSTGQVLKSGSTETSGPWSLSKIANCHFWLNHGFGNSDASASYDEVRIWKGALTDEQLNWNAWMGPDTVVIASANKRVCETLNIASGATLSSIYAGTTSFCNRLTGTGTLASHSTFVVEQKLDIAGEGFGTFTVDGRLNVRGDWILSCGASGASDRIVGAGVLDLSEAVLVPQFASKSFGSYLVAKGVTPVGYQNLVLPPRYLLDLADDKLYLRRNGFGIYVR